MTKRVFISLPMSGRDERHIKFDIERLKFAYKEYVEKHNAEDVEIVFVDNLMSPPEDNEERLYCLGEAVKKLGECDVCIFSRDFLKANGCLVEHYICSLYDIQIVKESYNGRLFFEPKDE